MILYSKMHKETNKEYGYRVLKGNIMNLTLKPGELISETELSKEFNLSRTPIREILNRLKSEHLIEVKAQVGTYVSQIDKSLIEEAVFMRYTLEREILFEAAKNISPEILMELEKNLFAQKLIVNKKDCDVEFHKLDTQFHQLLFEGVNKLNVWGSVQKISTHYNRMRLLSEMNTEKNIMVEQHEKYLEIIKKNDNKIENDVDGIITKHIINPMIRWEDMIENYQEIESYFKIKKM